MNYEYETNNMNKSNQMTTASIDSDYIYCSSDDGAGGSGGEQLNMTTIPSIVNPDTVMQVDHLHHDDEQQTNHGSTGVDLGDEVGMGLGLGLPTTHSTTTTSTTTHHPDKKDHDTIQILNKPLPIHNHNNTFQNLAISDDEESGEVDREYTGQFEGPEKTLEVCFRPKQGLTPPPPSLNGKVGLRTLPRHDLDLVCKRARCTILSSVSNQYLDAYVLSESSLFVYNYMIVLKTCGTTTLLRCLAILIELARSKLNLELDWVGYSRKNFNFPEDQRFPHGSFTQELEYLYSHKNLCDKLNGNGYTLGPITDDHWFVFVADKTIRSQMDLDNDRVLNIMMFDIDPTIGDLFYYNKYQKKKKKNDGTPSMETEEEEVRRISFEQTKAAGIDALCPGALFDPRAFEPCGYSMNAILYKSYCTMHITPEEGSSYASFETNQKLASYTSLINNVVRTFKPRKFVMTLMADEGGLKEINKNGNPFVDVDNSKIVVPNNVGDAMTTTMRKKVVYKRTNLASITVEDDCVCFMGNWSMEDQYGGSDEVVVRRSRGMTFT